MSPLFFHVLMIPLLFSLSLLSVPFFVLTLVLLLPPPDRPDVLHAKGLLMFLKTSPLTPLSEYAYSVETPVSKEARRSNVSTRVERGQEAVNNARFDMVTEDVSQSINTAKSAKSSVLPKRYTAVKALARGMARDSAEGGWGEKALRGTLTGSPPESTSPASMNFERIPATSAVFRNCSNFGASVADVGTVIPLDQSEVSSGGDRSQGSTVTIPLPASPWGPFRSGTHAADDGNGVSCALLQPR